MNEIKAAIIGGGAAGFFGAISLAESVKECEITIFEKSDSVLSKVKISGGGRCNVTNSCFDIKQLVKNYPRGEKELISVFHKFNIADTAKWFESKGIKLKTETDQRVFPVSDNSQTIIDCLMKQVEEQNIEIKLNCAVASIKKNNDEFEIVFANEEKYLCNKILVATGGSPKQESYKWLEDIGHKIIKPVPSLFSFTLKPHLLQGLEGVSVENAELKIFNHKFTGPVLITHMGLSGPAIIKLSSFAARDLSECDYKADLKINWIPRHNTESIFESLKKIRSHDKDKTVSSSGYFSLPYRLWCRLIELAKIFEDKRWQEISNDKLRILSEVIVNGTYKITGKSPFKEEFVTCGGVSLKDVDFKTMESKKCKGVYFAGEVLDIDGLTGGFNFQSAWSTGYIAGKAIVKNI